MSRQVRKVRLRAIKYGCDFRMNEVSQWQALESDPRFASVRKGGLGASDVVLFVNCGEDQLIWLLSQTSMTGPRDKALTLVDSRRWRILGGRWNPQLLGDYASAVGLELVGVRMFGEAYAEERKRRQLLAADREHFTYENHLHT